MSLFNNPNEFNNNYNDFMEISNVSTRIQKNKNINTNIPIFKEVNEFRMTNNAYNEKKLLVTGDRFIPYKNNIDNIQNFILNSSPFNNDSSSSKHKIDSSIESEKEKNYVNFVIDNMLKNSSDKYIIRNKNTIRQNCILSFSKSIYNTARKCKNKNKSSIDDNIKNHLNFSVKHNKSYYDDELLNEMDYNSNYEVVNNINNFIRYNNRRIITPENNNKIYRKIQKTPLRILDAPNLVDDYYLNILDWGKENIIAVALSNEIYLWNNDNLQTSLLMTYENKDNDDMNNYITSLSWMNNGICVGVGLPNGAIQLWDINKKIKLREINAHEDRISCLSWNEYILSSGSRDRYIKNFDVRNRHAEISKIKKHKQEICSLKYSNEGDLLASGGNDNIAYIWDIRNLKNYFIFLNENIYNNNYKEIKPYAVNNMHQAAIKAMSWCPWKRHILATGGGSKDQSIKIYSCDNNKLLKNIKTGSQVCTLLWNNIEKEIISSHGYNKNQIIIWNYEKNKKICELKGHMNRVLYLTMSPNERYICSGSGDETLRFWEINHESSYRKIIKENYKLTDNVIVH